MQGREQRCIVILNRTVKGSFTEKITFEPKKLRLLREEPSMVNLRFLPRPSTTLSDWFTASHDGGGKPKSQHALCCSDRKPSSQHALCCGCDRRTTGTSRTREPHPSQPMMQGPCTLRPQPRELSSVLMGSRAVTQEQTARQGWSLALSRGNSAHNDTPMNTPPASPFLSVLPQNSHCYSLSILGN